MKDRIIHQWRDWILEYVDNGKYELIQKEDKSIIPIAAKNHMDAENQCQVIIKEAIKKAKENKTDSSLETDHPPEDHAEDHANEELGTGFDKEVG